MKKLLLSVITIIFVVLLNFSLLVFNTKFYEKEFYKLNVYEKFEKEKLNENLNKLINFLRKNEKLETGFFNEKEKMHLEDVRILIRNALIMFYLFLILFIILIYLNKKNLEKPFLYSGIILLILPLVFYLINFSNFFLKFHETLFSNNLWLLNPETDNLINMFPENFFKDFVITVFIRSMFVGVLLILISLILRKKLITPSS